MLLNQEQAYAQLWMMIVSVPVSAVSSSYKKEISLYTKILSVYNYF